MACTPPKVLDDHTRMHVHGFSFFQRQMSFQNWIIKREIKKGAEYITTYKGHQEVQCTEQCPEIEIDVSISQLFTVFLASFQNHVLKKRHIFSGFGPTSLSYNANAASYPLNPGSRP